MGFAVIAEELRAAGRNATEAGEAVRAVDLASEAARFAGALPGSSVVAASGELSDGWARAVSSAADGWVRHGESLTASAQTYRATDSDAAESAEGLARPLGGSR